MCVHWHDFFFFLSGELLTERCRTNDLMPSIPVLCLPPSRVDPKVLGLNVLIYYHSQPGGSWTANRCPPIRWWSQRGGGDTAMVLLRSWSSQTWPQIILNRRKNMSLISSIIIFAGIKGCFTVMRHTIQIVWLIDSLQPDAAGTLTGGHRGGWLFNVCDHLKCRTIN